jgi:hypothetical protein
MQDGCREAFETHTKTMQGYDAQTLRRKPSGGYFCNFVNAGWIGWQAAWNTRAPLAPPKLPDEVEEKPEDAAKIPKVKRYGCFDTFEGAMMMEDYDGGYVSYDDYIALTRAPLAPPVGEVAEAYNRLKHTFTAEDAYREGDVLADLETLMKATQSQPVGEVATKHEPIYDKDLHKPTADALVRLYMNEPQSEEKRIADYRLILRFIADNNRIIQSTKSLLVEALKEFISEMDYDPSNYALEIPALRRALAAAERDMEGTNE